MSAERNCTNLVGNFIQSSKENDRMLGDAHLEDTICCEQLVNRLAKQMLVSMNPLPVQQTN